MFQSPVSAQKCSGRGVCPRTHLYQLTSSLLHPEATLFPRITRSVILPAAPIRETLTPTMHIRRGPRVVFNLPHTPPVNPSPSLIKLEHSIPKTKKHSECLEPNSLKQLPISSTG